MKVLAFAASNSRQSINKQLATYASSLVTHAEIQVLDLNDYEMPIYSTDREEATGIPQAAHDFFTQIGDADALLVSFAEYNGSYTAAYKNIFDWASRIDKKVFQNKPMIMLSTSPGPGGAQSVLSSATHSVGFFGGQLKGSLSVPSFYENFDSTKRQLTNPEIHTQLESVVKALL